MPRGVYVRTSEYRAKMRRARRDKSPSPFGLPLRFWQKVYALGNGCWEWTAARFGAEEYGAFWFGGRTIQAYRLAYETLVGPVADGLECDYLCRNRACVNPLHIEPVTHRENTLRGNSPVAINARRRQ